MFVYALALFVRVHVVCVCLPCHTTETLSAHFVTDDLHCYIVYVYYAVYWLYIHFSLYICKLGRFLQLDYIYILVYMCNTRGLEVVILLKLNSLTPNYCWTNTYIYAQLTQKLCVCHKMQITAQMWYSLHMYKSLPCLSSCCVLCLLVVADLYCVCFSLCLARCGLVTVSAGQTHCNIGTLGGILGWHLGSHSPPQFPAFTSH